MPVGPDAALGVPCGVWLAEVSESQESMVFFGRQTEVWLPDDRDESRVSRDTKGASWLPRMGTLRGGLEAM